MVPVGVRFELFVDDAERSLAFYGAVPGLRPPPGYDPRGYVPVSAGAFASGYSGATRYLRGAISVPLTSPVPAVWGWRS
jgi:catechol 2,3-dioxygenase-like lactoylglutathione lyase family enzyme